MENARNRQAAQANAFRVSTPVPAGYEFFTTATDFRYTPIDGSRSSRKNPAISHTWMPHSRLTECQFCCRRHSVIGQ